MNRSGGHGGLALLATATLAAALWSMTVGSSWIAPDAIFGALFSPDDSYTALIVTGVRLPRVLAALASGAALAVAGALMQAVTNNPLASPGLLGINAGAAFAVVLAILLLPPLSGGGYAWFAFAGAGLAGAGVYALGSAGAGGATPLKLALAGVIVTSFLTSLTTTVLVFDRATLDAVRMWTIGSLAGRQMETVAPLLVYVIGGLAVAIAVSRQVTTLSLGSEIAAAIGQNLVVWRLTCGALVIVLAGSAIAIAGPIGFVGLVVPHMARLLVGPDYRRIIPWSAFGGALLVVVADTVFRNSLPGIDLPVGVAMAMVGAPFFIHLARRRTLTIS